MSEPSPGTKVSWSSPIHERFQAASFTRVSEDLGNLLESGLESDFVINTKDGKKFQAHRCILAGKLVK
jgi:hypothetical protein